MLIGLGALCDRLGGVYFNEILRTSRLLCHGNFSGCRGNIPCSEGLLWLPPIFRNIGPSFPGE